MTATTTTAATTYYYYYYLLLTTYYLLLTYLLTYLNTARARARVGARARARGCWGGFFRPLSKLGLSTFMPVAIILFTSLLQLLQPPCLCRPRAAGPHPRCAGAGRPFSYLDAVHTSHGLLVKKFVHVAPPCQKGIEYLQAQAKNGLFSC